MNQIRIAIVGYGEFGSQFVTWLLTRQSDWVKIMYVIEWDGRKREEIRRLHLSAYSTWQMVPHEIFSQTQVIVDCTSKGQGPVNLALYQEFGIPAIFQNGESSSLCELFYAPLSTGISSCYVKIARCSALATLNVVVALQGALDIQSIYTFHAKVNNKDRMLDMGYESGEEISALTGIPARVDVVYMRGIPHDNYVYHGNLHLRCETSVKPSVVSDVLANSAVKACSQEIDSLTCGRTDSTYVVEEGVSVDGNLLRLNILSFTPEINFPHNLAAIKLLARRER
jgi:hypothetical protein